MAGLFLLSPGYLESGGGVEALDDLGVVKQTVGSISDGHHAAAAAVDVDTVHASECQADVCG